jgi:hypothetical protein
MPFNWVASALRGFAHIRSGRCEHRRQHFCPGLERLEDRTLLSLVQGGSFPVGQSPVAMVVGNFTGNGKQDIVTANRDSNSISILLGNGDGTFRSALSITVDAAPKSLAVGDFNGDGKLDIAVGCGDANVAGSENIDVLLGNGDGTFRAAPPIPMGVNTNGLVAGDFGRDGKLYLAAVSLSSSSVTILMGQGDGTFVKTGTLLLPSGAEAIAGADFNGDGKLDLAVVCPNFGTSPGSNNRGLVSIFLGNGNGTFATGVTYVAGLSPDAIAVADFNGDHKPDLAVADFEGHAVDVLLNNGNGTFQSATSFAAASNPQLLAVGDFNNDGVPDIVVSNPDVSQEINVLLGVGNGTFQAPIPLDPGSTPVGIAVGDFNADGRQDVAVGDVVANDVRVFLNQPGPDLPGFINQVYLDLLQRPADPAGLASWTALLKQGTTPTQIAFDVEQSLEYRTDEINKVYEQLLRRPADASGLQTGLQVLVTRGLETELEFVAGSQEFLRDAGGTNDGWVTAIFRDALNRAVDAQGRAAFDQELNSGVINLRQAAHIVFTSPEFLQDTIQSDYSTYLGRPPDSGGATAWLGELEAGVVTPEQVIAYFVGSTEHTSRFFAS